MSDAGDEIPEGWEKRVSRSTGMILFLLLKIFTKTLKKKHENAFPQKQPHVSRDDILLEQDNERVTMGCTNISCNC